MADPIIDPPTPAPSKPATHGGAETFSREYVSELRGENKDGRIKLTELSAKLVAAEQALAKAGTDATETVRVGTVAADARVIRAELKAVAIAAGMVDLDGLKMADLSSVKLDAAGEVTGAAELMAALKTAKPFLFGVVTTASRLPVPPPNPTAGASVRGLSAADYAARRAEATRR